MNKILNIPEVPGIPPCRKPIKPKPPEKYLNEAFEENLFDLIGYRCKEFLSCEEFFKLIKYQINTKDFKIWLYDNQIGVATFDKVKNENYDQEYQIYLENKKQYEIDLKEYNSAMRQYKKDMKKYEEKVEEMSFKVLEKHYHAALAKRNKKKK